MIDKQVWIIEFEYDNLDRYEQDYHEVIDVSLISVEDAMNKCERACMEYIKENYSFEVKEQFRKFKWNQNCFTNDDLEFNFYELYTQY